MQIDLAKLHRLEAAAEDARTLLLSVESRLRDKRTQISQKKMILLHEWRNSPGHSIFARLVEDLGWSEARLTKNEDFSRLEHGEGALRALRAIESFKPRLTG